MAIKIYGSFRWPFAMAAGLAVYEKDQEFELVRMDMKLPEYMNNFNPFGKSPSYQDEDIILFESKAIMKYVATKFDGQGSPLLGSTVHEQALCNQWLEVHSHSFTPPHRVISKAIFRNPEQPDASVVKPALEAFEKVLDIYEARLSASKYLAGDSYTLADLTHTPFFYMFNAIADEGAQKLLTSRKHVYAWIQDISSRPAWKKLTDRPENKYYKRSRYSSNRDKSCP
ncbi:hypothetical protein R1sor_026290 [Riccia sorocarpa]|uniref:glutathione transferase n=1 Tax=Riccia sorocarpa TaxID=122646 RepID=A0ABD3GDT5_9MARC